MTQDKQKFIYYDTAEYTLSKNDMWLRKLGESWELMIPTVGVFHKITGEENIRQVFGIVPQEDFEKDIAGFGYAPFCIIDAPSEKNAVDSFFAEKTEVIEYLKNKKPDHWQALVAQGVVGE